MQMDIHGCKYRVDKDAGFPQWHDEGRCDVRIHGKGMDVGLVLTPIKRDETTSMKVIASDCTIHHLDLDLYDTNHEYFHMITFT